MQVNDDHDPVGEELCLLDRPVLRMNRNDLSQRQDRVNRRRCPIALVKADDPATRMTICRRPKQVTTIGQRTNIYSSALEA